MADDVAARPPLDLEAAEQLRKWTLTMGRAQQMLMEFWAKEGQAKLPAALAAMPTEPKEVAEAASKVTETVTEALRAADPVKLTELQTDFWADAIKLWTSFAEGKLPEVQTRDRRFSGEAWRANPLFDLIRQMYLLTSRYLLETTEQLDGLDPEKKARLSFYTRQFIDAMSPSNFVATNPEVLQKTVETNGENLLKGLQNMLDDLSRGRMRMTDETAFEVGRNVAVTPGKVIFENRLFQLIQYAPMTEEVLAVPLVIFPPWINKFYILDLTAEKSFIRWAVEQGLTVFVVSWRNPNAELADVTIDHYVKEGYLEALDRVREATGQDSAHTIGYCVAGTTLAAVLALLAARGQAERVRTATFFTAQVDFEDAGELRVFIDDPQLGMLAQAGQEEGVVHGNYLATSFNMLRANDLIWSYVVNNYLLGKDYMPFDLLFWNSDATNVPALWHQAYLRDLYRDNRLAKPGGVTIDGVPIDLSLVKTPSYVQAGRDDHIAPAKSVYKITSHFTGPIRFVLAGSGHIAGVVNPPSANKYQYWTNEALPPTLDEFIAGAKETKGSWWPDWFAWIEPQSDGRVPASTRIPGEGPLPAIEDAPGRYVKERI